MAIAGHPKTISIPSERETKLCGYVKQVAGQGLISSDMADTAWQAWEELSRGVPGLAVPDACPGPDGTLLFTWDRGEHHLELEFYADEPPSFFYANRKTGALWEAPYNTAEHIPAEVKTKLKLFLAEL
jgi:hypothetical protein